VSSANAPADPAEIERARTSFKTMPPEVFDLWIVPGIDSHGWPFSSVNDSVIGTAWDSFFIGRPLSFWANVEWRLLSLPMNESVYHPETALRVRWIFGNCALGEQTPTANLQDTKKRFWTAASFIQVNGKLPSPIVGITTKEGFEIVDGHHRLAALVFLRFPNTFSLPAWIAIPESR
jgi:ParB-like nuclease domain